MQRLPTESRWWFALACTLATSLLTLLTLPMLSWWWLCPLVPAPLMWLAWRWQGRTRTLLAMVWAGSLPVWAYQQWWVSDISKFGYVPFVMLQACWAVLYAWLVWRMRVKAPRMPFVLMTALLWVAVEVFRGEVFLGGYAWGYVGHPLIDATSGVGLARWGGAPLASLVCTTSAAAIVGLFVQWQRRTAMESTARHSRLWPVIAVFGAMVLWAAGLFAEKPPKSEAWPVAVIQTNVSQDVKSEWAAEDEVRDYVRFQAMTMQAASVPEEERPGLIVWPETMMPGPAVEENVLGVLREARIFLPLKAPMPEFGLTEAKIPADDFAKSLFELSQRTGVAMLVGEEGFENFRVQPTGKENEVEFKYDKRFNSVYLVRDGRLEAQRYDKIAITPFGEYMPVIQYWPWLVGVLRDFAADGMRFDLTPGTRRTVFEISGKQRLVRCVTPICFESTVSDLCRRLVFNGTHRRADLLVNLTNDGWFNTSMVTRVQHLQMARWRCAELGTPMVRAANTGLSAIIDARGQVVAQGVDGNPAAMNVGGILSGSVPLVASDVQATPFVRWGWMFAWGVLAVGGVAVAIAVWPARRARGASEGVGRPPA